MAGLLAGRSEVGRRAILCSSWDSVSGSVNIVPSHLHDVERIHVSGGDLTVLGGGFVGTDGRGGGGLVGRWWGVTKKKGLQLGRGLGPPLLTVIPAHAGIQDGWCGVTKKNGLHLEGRRGMGAGLGE